MKLNCLQKGSHVKSKKRVGRGIGSGRGKTSSRGVKGQKARSGSAINGFEGGQQSVITSLPKRGFKSRYTVKPTCFNIGYIQKLYDSGKVKKDDVLDNQFFSTLKLIKSASHKVKILGKGDFSIPLIFKVNAVSDNAKNIIEKAGGSVEIYG